MPRVDVPKIIDDYDGKELPEDTKPTNLSYMGQRYTLYLSDDNAGKLFDFLHKFTENADVAYDDAKVKRQRAQADDAEKKAQAEQTKQVRHWALKNNIKVDGKPINERGRITQAFVDAWKEAGSPGIE